MAKRINVSGLDEVKKMIEDGRIRIPRRVEWKTTRVEARSIWGMNFGESSEAVLEARAGEDGVFRVDLCEEKRDGSDPWGELEKLREKLRERESELEKFIFGVW